LRFRVFHSAGDAWRDLDVMDVLPEASAVEVLAVLTWGSASHMFVVPYRVWTFVYGLFVQSEAASERLRTATEP
jgi:hypothetical protein